MPPLILQTPENVTLLGGGNASVDELAEALSFAPTLVAADGGAELAVRAGRVPTAVIGDMDSLSEEILASLPAGCLHPIAEQDSTDFDKALRSVSAPLVLGVGFLGGRLDHELANLNVLARRSAQKCILIGAEDVVFHAPPRITLALDPGSRLSLFPMREVTGRSTGLEWPIDGLTLAPNARVGTSNCVSGEGLVTLEFDVAGMLVILPRAALVAVIAAFGC